MANAPRGARAARLVLTTVVVGTLVLASTTLGGSAAAEPTGIERGRQAAPSSAGTGNYLVLLVQPPVASYGGQVRAQPYTAALREHQRRVAAAVDADPFYSYTESLNGFAAGLSADQARRLTARDDVAAVVPDRIRTLAGRASGVSSSGAAQWVSPIRPVRGRGTGGGLVVGVVDTGVDSDSSSFAPTGTGSRGTRGGFRGGCQSSSDPDQAADYTCSAKLVGGSYFLEGQGGARAVWEGEFLSPEDYHGHGSRTASIAAGTKTRAALSDRLGLGPVSGVAPGARVAAYKACWATADGSASCTTSDLVAAIDEAVADGVDVLSYAVDGATTDAADPVELAFLHAADAGVFVAASAGNGGPGASTVAHPSPWVTTIGAATSPTVSATVVLGDGERYRGAPGAPVGVPSSPLVLARDAAATDANPVEAQLCLPDSLDPDRVVGAIVVCDRGSNDRVAKSAAVASAGGIGMLLVNPTSDSIDTDLHSVPTVHLPDTAYDGLYAYADAAEQPTARIKAPAGGARQPTDVAPSSGRGPTAAARGDILKPDLVAAGTDVLAAVTPERARGNSYGLGSGTSVAAGYVAGLALLVRAERPGWSPMAVKSALMTTAADLTDGSAGTFGRGAGIVRPRRMLDPGLVFDSDYADWSAYLASQGYAAPSRRPAVRASNLNTPSVAIDSLAGRETVRRTVTNVAGSTSTYSVRKAGLEGVSVSAFPSVFTLGPGGSQTVRLRFERDTAPLGSYETGFVRLNDSSGGHRVRIPVAVQPVGVRAPRRLRLDGDGATTVRTRAGVTATMVAKVRGPAAGNDTTARGADTGGVNFDPRLSGLWSQTIEVAGPAELVRVQTLPDRPADDLDLFLLDEQGFAVASSATAAAAEELTVRGLDAGTYTIYVQPWFVADPSGDTTFTVRTFQVPRRQTGPLSVEPRRQSVGAAGQNRWRVEADGLRSGKPYLGWVGWYADRGSGDTLAGRTLVSVD